MVVVAPAGTDELSASSMGQTDGGPVSRARSGGGVPGSADREELGEPRRGPGVRVCRPSGGGSLDRVRCLVNIFLVYVRDEAYYRLLPEATGAAADGRIRVMAFPPLGIETLAPVLRRAGHRVTDVRHLPPADEGGGHRPGGAAGAPRRRRALLPLGDRLPGHEGAGADRQAGEPRDPDHRGRRLRVHQLRADPLGLPGDRSRRGRGGGGAPARLPRPPRRPRRRSPGSPGAGAARSSGTSRGR